MSVLIDRMSKQIESIRSLLMQKKEQITQPGLCSLSMTFEGICLAYAKPEAGKLVLQYVGNLPISRSQTFASVLSAAVAEHHLSGMECVWILQPESYQTFLMEALPVADNEFQAAIRWKVKSMISFPIEDAVIDYYKTPEQKTHKPTPMIMTIVSQISYLAPYVKKIQATGLRLTTIDIDELALRNITALFETDEKTTALIYLRNAMSYISLTNRKTLYFERAVDFGLDAIGSVENVEQTNPSLDKLALELQRSIDYFQTQWRLPLPSRIFITSVVDHAQVMAEYLTARLAMPIQELDLSSVLSSHQPLTLALQGENLAVLGGVIRNEVMANASRN